MCVFGDRHKAVVDLLENELTLMFFVESFEDLLNDMRPLKVLRKLNYMRLEGLGDKKFLSRAVDQVKHRLDCVGASHVAADLDKVLLDHS